MHRIFLEQLKQRAASPNSSTPRPFLRWAGSKRYLLKYLVNVLPNSFKTYREPFLGSGSLYFLLQPSKACLSDKSPELIDSFRAIKENAKAVLNNLSKINNDKETYYHIRANRSSNRYKKAAEFLFLNKTCWNGLYRVNSSGEFNVPYGYVKLKDLVDKENIALCAQLLNNSHTFLEVCDFEENLSKATKGDLVYLDPPYTTGHNNNGFISYNENIFSWEDQIRLATLANKLVEKGVYVIVSNANHDEILKLYPNFTRLVVERSSTISSKNKGRGKITEIVLSSQN